LTSFDETWRSAVRYRRVSRELEPLLSEVHADLLRGDVHALRASVERLLIFLAGETGRTDANCSAVDSFFNAVESSWRALPPEWCALFDDMSGTLHDAVHRPDIASTFEATPEQLLQRVRNIVT
jgi:hypothetical protein